MSDWITGTMIQRYVEERFSTYTKLMNLALEMKENMSEEDRSLARFSNFIAFTDNIASEVHNIFKVDVAIDKREHEDYNRPFSRVFETHIIYDNIAVGHYGFSIEINLLKEYQEGYNYGKIN